MPPPALPQLDSDALHGGAGADGPGTAQLIHAAGWRLRYVRAARLPGYASVQAGAPRAASPSLAAAPCLPPLRLIRRCARLPTPSALSLSLFLPPSPSPRTSFPTLQLMESADRPEADPAVEMDIIRAALHAMPSVHGWKGAAEPAAARML